MIILDTNVISEVMREAPEPSVVSWLNHQPSSSIWTTAITVFEIEHGLRRMRRGRRRKRLEQAFEDVVLEDLDGRVLAFDLDAARSAGALGSDLEAKGLPMEIRDLQIASIARVHDAVIATRNVRHFESSCRIHNPWER